MFHQVTTEPDFLRSRIGIVQISPTLDLKGAIKLRRSAAFILSWTTQESQTGIAMKRSTFLDSQITRANWYAEGGGVACTKHRANKPKLNSAAGGVSNGSTA